MRELRSKLQQSVKVLPSEAFHARVQKQMRVQIPRLLRWKYQLKPGMVLRVQVTKEASDSSSPFLVRMQRGGRITIPRATAESLNLNPRQLVETTIWIPPEDASK